MIPALITSTTRMSRLLYKKLYTSVQMSTNIRNQSEEKKSNDVHINYLDGKDNGIAVLGLNRPETRNALSRTLVSDLSAALSGLSQDEKIRVLIIRSLIPNVFCAGADLRERANMTSEDEVAEFVSSLRELMDKVEAVPIPVISAIDGFALGGGLELALATDIRTAACEAKIGLVETKLAIIPGAGGTQRLPRLIGSARAKELIFTGRVFDAQHAVEIGLVNRTVPQNKSGDAAYQAALNIAREILPNGPIGVKMAKCAITRGFEESIRDGLMVEKDCYEKVLNTRDRLEGLAAFSSKRVPIYRGH